MGDNFKLKMPPRSPPIPIKKNNNYGRFYPEPAVKTRSYINIETRTAKKKLIEFKKKFEFFKKELEIFKELKKGEKLGKEKINTEDLSNDNKETEVSRYYKQEPYYGLWISRWWYSEGREKTVNYLDEDFTEFVKFLDNVLEYINIDPTSTFISFVNEIREFINSILEGLYNLKQTYPEFVKIVAKVDSIILKII